MGQADSLIAEAWASRDGLRLACELEIPRPHGEVDSKILFDVVRGNAKSDLSVDPIVVVCRENLS